MRDRPTQLELLTTEDLSKILKMSKTWIRLRTYDGTIPHVKLGRCTRYVLLDVLKALGLDEKGE